MRYAVAPVAVLLFGCLRSSAQEPEEKLVTITVTKDQRVSGFLDAAALLVGRPILYDPNGQRVAQAMGVDLVHGVPKGKELDTVRAILAFYEITLVPVGPSGHEILLALDSRSTNNLVKNKAEYVPFDEIGRHAERDGFYMMTSIPVRHIENLTLLRTALSTMVTPAGIGRVHEVSGRIVVMDYAPTVAAMARVVKEMDVDPEPVVTQTIVLQHAHAVALAGTLKELFGGEPQKPDPRQGAMPGRVAPGPRIAAYEPGNALVVVATEKDVARIREVVKQLDVPPAG